MLLKYLHGVINNLSANPFRIALNLWPPFLGAGIKIMTISADYLHIKVRLKMHWYNTNYVGVHFGGSLYAMVDPFYMLILLKKLGNDYIVWDKSAQIDFIKPGKGSVYAEFNFTEDEIQSIRSNVDQAGKLVFAKSVEIKSTDNEVVAYVVKNIYVRKK